MKRIDIQNLSVFVMVFVLILAGSCKKDDPNLVPGNVILVSPLYSAFDVALDITLLWQAASDPNGDAVTYDVYLGTEAIPVTVVSHNQTATNYNLALAVNTTYYWKVAAKDSKGGISESSVWSFTTDIIIWSDDTHGIFTDPRDNNEYIVVKIGEQIWFAESLSYEISGKEITDNTQWVNNMAYDGWCYYENDKTNYGSTYGILYQWNSAKSACPTGWHLPGDEEWKELEMFLGMSKSEADNTGWRGMDEGGKLKETGITHWNSPNTGATNESGFSALPGGFRYSIDGSFSLEGNYGFWWSATRYSGTYAWYRSLVYNTANIERANTHNMSSGFSVYCIRD